MHTREQLFHDVEQAKAILIVTGAGISVASGIAPFRGSDPDAVWNQDVMEKATFGYFRADPVGSWDWYLKRFDSIIDKEPNEAHHALVAMEQWANAYQRDFLLVTQNIDGLHTKASSQQLVEIHGSAQYLRCSQDGCKNGAPHGTLPRRTIDLGDFKRHKKHANLPQCQLCGQLLRPHVLWFDEMYTDHQSYGYAKTLNFAETADLLIFIGTSFAVGITESLYQYGFFSRTKMWSIDPHAKPEHSKIRWLQEPAESCLPIIAEQLTALAPP